MRTASLHGLGSGLVNPIGFDNFTSNKPKALKFSIERSSRGIGCGGGDIFWYRDRWLLWVCLGQENGNI